MRPFWKKLISGFTNTLKVSNPPVLNCVEGLLVSDVIHEQEAHGSSVVGCGDGTVALLSCCILCLHTHKIKSIFPYSVLFGRFCVFIKVHETIKQEKFQWQPSSWFATTRGYYMSEFGLDAELICYKSALPPSQWRGTIIL